jgi:hypothetical protein
LIIVFGIGIGQSFSAYGKSSGINITKNLPSTAIDTNVILNKINAQETNNSKISNWVKNIFE